MDGATSYIFAVSLLTIWSTGMKH